MCGVEAGVLDGVRKSRRDRFDAQVQVAGAVCLRGAITAGRYAATNHRASCSRRSGRACSLGQAGQQDCCPCQEGEIADGRHVAGLQQREQRDCWRPTATATLPVYL